jgi:hypothetical protein
MKPELQTQPPLLASVRSSDLLDEREPWTAPMTERRFWLLCLCVTPTLMWWGLKWLCGVRWISARKQNEINRALDAHKARRPSNDRSQRRGRKPAFAALNG